MSQIKHICGARTSRNKPCQKKVNNPGERCTIKTHQGQEAMPDVVSDSPMKSNSPVSQKRVTNADLLHYIQQEFAVLREENRAMKQQICDLEERIRKLQVVTVTTPKEEQEREISNQGETVVSSSDQPDANGTSFQVQEEQESDCNVSEEDSEENLDRRSEHKSETQEEQESDCNVSYEDSEEKLAGVSADKNEVTQEQSEVQMLKALAAKMGRKPIIPVYKPIPELSAEEKAAKQKRDNELMAMIDCQALNKQGKPCGNKAFKFERYCSEHENYKPPKEKEKCKHVTNKGRCKNFEKEAGTGYCWRHKEIKDDSLAPIHPIKKEIEEEGVTYTSLPPIKPMLSIPGSFKLNPRLNW